MRRIFMGSGPAVMAAAFAALPMQDSEQSSFLDSIHFDFKQQVITADIVLHDRDRKGRQAVLRAIGVVGGKIFKVLEIGLLGFCFSARPLSQPLGRIGGAARILLFGEAPEPAVGPDRRAGKRGLFPHAYRISPHPDHPVARIPILVAVYNRVLPEGA